MTRRPVPALIAILVPPALTACAGADASAPATSVAAPFTGPAQSLAPSQLSRATVAPPPTLGRCDQADLTITAALGEGGAADPAVVVTLHNTGSVECEVDLGTAWGLAHDVEPSVWLAPGASADLWGDGPDCASDAPEWPLEINGRPETVVLPAGAPCPVAPTAFFPT